jgi:hypothetical protein
VSNSSKLKPPPPPAPPPLIVDDVNAEGVEKSPSPSTEMSGNAETALSKSMSPTAEEGAVANSEPMSGKSVMAGRRRRRRGFTSCGGCDSAAESHAFEHSGSVGPIPPPGEPSSYCTPYRSKRCIFHCCELKIGLRDILGAQEDIRQIDFRALKKAGYGGAVFDKDNCLVRLFLSAVHQLSID